MTTLTDGFHLVVDALKANDVDTIYGIVGIPITDLARVAQASGIRYIGFRQETSAGNAAAAAGFLTGRPGVCLTTSGPGFLNGLPALANATTNCFPDDSDFGIEQSSAGRLAARRLSGPRSAQRGKAFREGGLPRSPGSRTSDGASHARFAPRSPAARAASTSISRAPCWARPWRPPPERTACGGSSTPRPGNCRHRTRSIARSTCSLRRTAPADRARQGCGLRAGRQRDSASSWRPPGFRSCRCRWPRGCYRIRTRSPQRPHARWRSPAPTRCCWSARG